jgi:hypothetical protein
MTVDATRMKCERLDGVTAASTSRGVLSGTT